MKPEVPSSSVSGVTLWLTGMSGAGKSTLSSALAKRLQEFGVPVEILDGDIVRTHLSQGLGYTREDRDVNVRRIGFVAGLLARHGVFVISAVISPYIESRQAARALSPRFVEIFVNAPLETLIERDPKGLYEKALKGEIPNFTGVSDPYEPPEAPEIEIRTDQMSVEDSIERIIAYLSAEGILPTASLQPDASGRVPA